MKRNPKTNIQDLQFQFLDFNTAPGHQSDALSLPRTPMSAHSTGTGSGTGNRLSRQSRPGETHSTPSPDARSLQSIIAMYEAGDKGTLHPDLSSLMEPWMSYCHKTGEKVAHYIFYSLKLISENISFQGHSHLICLVYSKSF